MKKKIKKFDLLDKIYERDLNSNVFTIKISIDQYTDIFNDLDPSPMKSRDINQELLMYLTDSSDDIPLKHKLRLLIVGPTKIKDVDKEKKVKAGLHIYFSLYILSLKKKIHLAYEKSIKYFLAFIIFIGLSYYLEPIMSLNVATQTLEEGLSIGAWVFLWEAMDQIFFSNRETVTEEKKYKRLREAKIRFQYIKA